MDMSAAALPARTGKYTHRDLVHPLFPVYRQYRNSMQRQMVDSSDFRDWLSCFERDQLNEQYAKHPRYPEFLDWMRANQGGARPCCPAYGHPQGVAFPVNFEYWLIGGRW